MRQTPPSSSMCIPFLNWFVLTCSATAASLAAGRARGAAARSPSGVPTWPCRRPPDAAKQADHGEDDDHDDDHEQPADEDAPPSSAPPRFGGRDPRLRPAGAREQRLYATSVSSFGNGVSTSGSPSVTTTRSSILIPPSPGR